MTTETLQLPVEEGIDFLEKSSAVLNEVIKLPIADMPLALIVALMDLRDSCRLLHLAMAEMRCDECDG